MVLQGVEVVVGVGVVVVAGAALNLHLVRVMLAARQWWVVSLVPQPAWLLLADKEWLLSLELGPAMVAPVYEEG